MRIQKLFTLIIILLSFCKTGNTQNIELGVQLGGSSFNMADLKSLNNQVFDNLEFDAMLVSNFPSYVNFGFYCSNKFNSKFDLGIKYSRKTTGSRISSSDYSGDYIFDMLLKGNDLGIISNLYLFSIKDLRFSFYNSVGVIFSSLTLNESLNIFREEILSETKKLSAISLYDNPNLRLSYHFHQLGISIYNGYLFDFFSSPLTLNNDSKQYLIDKNDDIMKANWSGLNFGAIVSYSF
jgi:hypothetical protein